MWVQYYKIVLVLIIMNMVNVSRETVCTFIEIKGTGVIRHIVTWNFKEGISDTENRQNALTVKTELENLKKVIKGIIELKVFTDALPSSNRDLVLNSLFDDEKALSEYQIHPEHKRVSAYVGTVLQNRACIDYYEE